MAPPSSCTHAAVIRALDRGCERMNQLRSILLPLPPADPLSELAAGLFDEALRFFSTGLSMLEPGGRPVSCCHLAAAQDSSASLGGCKKRMNPDEERETQEEGDKNTARKRRRIGHLRPIETSLPHTDGHQWRKYGQKQISGSKYPRSYYRCIYRYDQGCQATKTVQLMDNGNPPKFIVTYDKLHECKPVDTYSPVVIDSNPRKASAFGFEENSFKGPQEQPLLPLAAEDKSNDSMILPESPGVLSKNSVAGHRGLWGEISNMVSLVSPDLDDHEWMNHVFSLIA